MSARWRVCQASIDVIAMPLPVARVIFTLDLHEKCVSSRLEVAVESPVEFAGIRVVPAFDLGKPRKLRPACGAESCRIQRTAAVFRVRVRVGRPLTLTLTLTRTLTTAYQLVFVVISLKTAAEIRREKKE